ncbi:MAG: TonB-dependent receptor family protein [candidate division WOR-3 bacterium]|nr:TonB-dependent receptor family protein [candidate division WOR-3 bacterium]
MRKLFLTVIILLNTPLIAQSLHEAGSGRIFGRVLESLTGQPIELANIVLYDLNRQIVTGTASDSSGRFFLSGIKLAKYIIEISFIGFESKVDTIQLSIDKPVLNMGIIKLEPKPITLEGIEVTSEKTPVEFKIDKKVINVREHYPSHSGTAVDVLQNIPSINVDVEGNVTLRGSSNFRVLIDNIPTILEPSDALQQIPASTIDKIEIITNPSARYDPEGLAGIINVITRKNTEIGLNGIANMNIGLEQKYSGDLLLNYRHKKFRTFYGFDYNNFKYPGTELESRETKTFDTVFYTLTRGSGFWLRRFYGSKLGSEYMINSRSKLSFNFELRKRGMERYSAQELTRWTIPGDTANLFRSNHTVRGGPVYAANASYINSFKKGEKLDTRFSFHISNGEDKSTNELSRPDSVIQNGWQSIEKGPMKRFLFNIDYTKPLFLPGITSGKLETGTQITIFLTGGGQDVYVYDTISRQYLFHPEFSHLVDFVHNIYSIYLLQSGEFKNFGYQAGLRGEYTYRFVQLSNGNENIYIKRWDPFPTIHLSYKFPPFDQIMISYTRRVNRPRDFDLEPFEIRRDPYSVFKGNPELLPEFVDAFELGYQKQSVFILFALDAYYRITRNKIEHISQIYRGDTMLHTIENIGQDYTLGLEPTIDFKITKWLNINLSANLYEHRIEGTLEDVSFSQKSRSWSLRNTSTITIQRGTRLQLNGIFTGPDITAQGERRPSYIINGGIRQEIIPRVLNFTLQVRDILGTGKFVHTSEGINFSIHQEHTRKSPVILLGLSYNFNNYRPEPKKYETERDFEETEENSF